MAKYSDIKGFTVQTLSTDTVASQIAGGSWASGGALNTARANLGSSGSGPQSATLAFGGSPYPRSQTALTELYNGSSWTEVNDLNTVRDFCGGAGVSTSAMCLGGHVNVPTRDNIVELWDGSSWTETTDMNVAVAGRSSAGASNTAVLGFGGYTPGSDPSSLPTGQVAQTELWNGSTWTEVNDLNSARIDGAGSGTSTAAILSTGYKSSPEGTVTDTESWDGTSWTAVGNVNTKRFRLGQGGTYTDQLIFGGSPYPPVASTATEAWNGTSWTEVNDLSTSRGELEGSGTSSADAIGFGGATSSTAVTAVTEEWSAPAVFNQITEGQLFFNSTTNTFKETLSDIPAGSFASGGNLNRNRYVIGGCGVSTAALAAGGDFYAGPPNSPSDRSGVDSEVYNGSTWTEVADMNNDVQGTYSASGTSTAAITNANSAPDTHIESWNGSAWTNAPDINSPRADASIPSGGSQTASLMAGGYQSPGGGPQDLVEQYDGSSWSEITEINTGRYSNRNTGTSTDNLVFGGTGTPSYTGKTEHWNGTAWTELNDLPVGVSNHGGFGTGSTLAVTTNGNGPNSLGAPNPTGANSSKALNFWNGTSWSADADDAPYKVRNPGSGGSATDGLVFGGIGDPNTPVYTTVEWTVDLSNKTITSS